MFSGPCGDGATECPMGTQSSPAGISSASKRQPCCCVRSELQKVLDAGEGEAARDECRILPSGTRIPAGFMPASLLLPPPRLLPTRTIAVRLERLSRRCRPFCDRLSRRPALPRRPLAGTFVSRRGAKEVSRVQCSMDRDIQSPQAPRWVQSIGEGQGSAPSAAAKLVRTWLRIDMK